jgi:hypothetical protein
LRRSLETSQRMAAQGPVKTKNPALSAGHNPVAFRIPRDAQQFYPVLIRRLTIGSCWMASDPTVNPLHGSTLLGSPEPFVILLQSPGMSSVRKNIFAVLSTSLWMGVQKAALEMRDWDKSIYFWRFRYLNALDCGRRPPNQRHGTALRSVRRRCFLAIQQRHAPISDANLRVFCPQIP